MPNKVIYSAPTRDVYGEFLRRQQMLQQQPSRHPTQAIFRGISGVVDELRTNKKLKKEKEEEQRLAGLAEALKSGYYEGIDQEEPAKANLEAALMGEASWADAQPQTTSLRGMDAVNQTLRGYGEQDRTAMAPVLDALRGDDMKFKQALALKRAGTKKDDIYRPPTPEERKAFNLTDDADVMVNNATGKPEYIGAKRSNNPFSLNDARYDAQGNLVIPMGRLTQDAAAITGAKEGAKKQTSFNAKVMDEIYNSYSIGAERVGILQQGIDAIDSGARTGVLENLLPSFTKASLELENVRNQLGLKVISSVTFGALSEKEMQMAFATALPTDMNPQDLRRWMVEAQAAQKKAMNIMDEYMTYLDEGGTPQGWVREQRKVAREKAKSTGNDNPYAKYNLVPKVGG